MQPHLVLEAHHLEIVALSRRAFVVGNELGHQEQADPLGSLRRVRQPRQHQMADVFGQIVIAPADIDLLARDRIGAVAVVLRP